jgi:hypothetical protein
MPDPKHVEFVTRHFEELQSIRFAPVPALMLLTPFAHRLAHMDKVTARGILSDLLVCVIGLCWWSMAAFKRRYGSVKPSPLQAQRMRGHPALVALIVIALATMSWFYLFGPRRYGAYVYFAFILLNLMLRTILDSTNPPSRRVVWTIGLVVLCSAEPFLKDVDGGAAVPLLGGIVWLSLSIFDFLLLRRTLAEISASPSSGFTEPVAQFG